MSLIETRLSRSTAFIVALRLRGKFDPSNGDHWIAVEAAYKASLILLSPLRLRRLKTNECDERFLSILHDHIEPYHRLVSEHGMEYFERLKNDGGEFLELKILRRRKRNLIEAWHKTYPPKSKAVLITVDDCEDEK